MLAHYGPRPAQFDDKPGRLTLFLSPAGWATGAGPSIILGVSMIHALSILYLLKRVKSYLSEK